MAALRRCQLSAHPAACGVSVALLRCVTAVVCCLIAARASGVPNRTVDDVGRPVDPPSGCGSTQTYLDHPPTPTALTAFTRRGNSGRSPLHRRGCRSWRNAGVRHQGGELLVPLGAELLVGDVRTGVLGRNNRPQNDPVLRYFSGEPAGSGAAGVSMWNQRERSLAPYPLIALIR